MIFLDFLFDSLVLFVSSGLFSSFAYILIGFELLIAIGLFIKSFVMR